MTPVWRETASGAIALDEAIRRSPFLPEPTGEALESALLEIDLSKLTPRTE